MVMPAKPSFRLHLGAAYYPEHWSEERWAEDIRLMKAAGLTVVRMAEFAWSTLEPEEGRFTFDWLERAISQLAEAGIVSVLGTPTASPPAWLVYAHPDIFTTLADGRKVNFGNRCHFCANSPEYHAAIRRIVTAMGERFGSNPHVIGWQLDNEYNTICYCDHCRHLFQQYLKQRYGTLEELNRRWTTNYWSQTYYAWDQIPYTHNYNNPGLHLEACRFVTQMYRNYQLLQIECLRPHLKTGDFITHNFMGWFDKYDHYQLTEDLDLASWDYYVGCGHHAFPAHAAIHDLTRGFKRQNYWVMETQPGTVNWHPINTHLDKGEARVMAWQAVGHGADAILYWQWRSALGGQEQYHGSLVDQSGQPRPFYEEVQRLGEEFARVSHLLADTRPAAKVAILNDYDSRWAIQNQLHHKDFNYVDYLTSFYNPLAANNIPVDIISAREKLDGYRLVIAPALNVLNVVTVANLKEFIRRGGKLVLTARTGMKDEWNALFPARQPGPLAELAGVEIEEYYALQHPIPVKGKWIDGEARIWAERIKIKDEKITPVMATYGESNGWLDGQVAICVHSSGPGMVYYVGTWLDEANQAELMAKITAFALVKPVMESPAGVEVCLRQGEKGREVYVVINHEKVEKSMLLPWTAHEHLSDCHIGQRLNLPPYGVAVITPEDLSQAFEI